MHTTRQPNRTLVALAATLAALVLGVTVSALTPAAVGADTQPVDAILPTTVSSDVLPTVQINGVVWDTVIVGNTVYATGDFTRARPAGSPAGQNETVRSHILAFDITTGDLITSWAPALNAQGLAIDASDDGSTIYVGGDFDQVNGEWRSRVAAIDAVTGALVPGFDPLANTRVAAIDAIGDTVYFGGHFTTVDGEPRSRLAAVSTDGTLLPWAPSTEREVLALVAHGPTGRVIVGGSFNTLNGAAIRGMGSLDAVTGETMPWAINSVVTNGGEGSVISDLITDGRYIYGTGWAFTSDVSGQWEGQFAADPATGDIVFINGCRGDTYGVAVVDQVMYAVGHAHDCGMVGGQFEMPKRRWNRAMAFTADPSPNGRYNAYGPYGGWNRHPGLPSAEVLHWYPEMSNGTFTGTNQAAFTVEGAGDYLVLGGEFPRVNGVSQQGLVRFAKRSVAPNKDTLQGYPTLKPIVKNIAPGTVRVGWTGAYDRDNEMLTYEVLRGDDVSTAQVLDTSTQTDSTAWEQRLMGYVDTTAPGGSTQTYRIRVTDPFGNGFASAPTTVTIPTGTPTTPRYSNVIDADGPVRHWRLGHSSGSTAYDHAGSDDLTLTPAATPIASTPIVGDGNGATSFPGTSSTSSVIAQPNDLQAAPQVFSVEAWVRTSTTLGGQVIGYGNSRTGRSSANTSDRVLYMTNDGQFRFGVRPDYGTRLTVASAPGKNDGNWHHVVGTLGTGGLALYVDGALVALDDTITTAQEILGYWRIAGDRLSSWPAQPTHEAIAADLDEVAVYHTALNAQQVRAHYDAGIGRPVASFTSEVNRLDVTFDGSASTAGGAIVSYDWNFGDGTTGNGRTTTHTYAAAGDYPVSLTVTTSNGFSDTTSQTVTVTEPPPPSVYAKDAFERTMASGLGTADFGGDWAITGPAGDYATDGRGLFKGTAGRTRSAYLPNVGQQDVDIKGTYALDQAATSGEAYLSILGRQTSVGNDYSVKLRYQTNGSVAAYLVRRINGASTVVNWTTVPGLVAGAGDQLGVRLQISGTDTTTVRAKVWRAAEAEPAGWTVSATETTPSALQAPGAVGFDYYVTSSWAGAGPVMAVDDYKVRAPYEGTVPGAPVAAFTLTSDALEVTADGSSSSDDSSIASYSWDLGDGSTATGESVVHTYAASGTYVVTLTVTDDEGLTATASEAIAVSDGAGPPPAFAFDSFSRTVTNGFGTSELGGSWSLSGSAADFSVADAGRIRVDPGKSRAAYLTGVTSPDVDLVADLTLDSTSATGDAYVSLIGRRISSGNDYRLKLRYQANGQIVVYVVRAVGGAETVINHTVVPDLTATAGETLRVRFEVRGTETATVRAKLWRAVDAEPATWLVTQTEAAPAVLQAAGHIGVVFYSTSSWGAPGPVLTVDDIRARPAYAEAP